MNQIRRYGQQVRSVFETLFHDEKGWASLCYDLTMGILVMIVCIDFVVQTYPITDGVRQFLIQVDFGITLIFLADYILRWWVARWSVVHVFSPMAVIDLIAILPLFLTDMHWQIVRMLRVFRILRLLRILQRRKFYDFKIRELHQRLLTIFFTIFCIVFISSGLVYDIESRSNPDFETFFDAVWFSVISITTVGYGDIVPITPEGRAITLLVIGTGIVLLPWQLTSLLEHIVQRRTKTKIECQKCGLYLHDLDAKYCRGCGASLNVSDFS